MPEPNTDQAVQERGDNEDLGWIRCEFCGGRARAVCGGLWSAVYPHRHEDLEGKLSKQQTGSHLRETACTEALGPRESSIRQTLFLSSDCSCLKKSLDKRNYRGSGLFWGAGVPLQELLQGSRGSCIPTPASWHSGAGQCPAGTTICHKIGKLSPVPSWCICAMHPAAALPTSQACPARGSTHMHALSMKGPSNGQCGNQ